MAKPTKRQWTLTTDEIQCRLARIEVEMATIPLPTIDDARSWLSQHAHEWDHAHHLTDAQRKNLSPLARTLRKFIVLPEDALRQALGQLGATVARRKNTLGIERWRLEHVLEYRAGEAAVAMLDDAEDDDVAPPQAQWGSQEPRPMVRREVMTSKEGES